MRTMIYIAALVLLGAGVWLWLRPAGEGPAAGGGAMAPADVILPELSGALLAGQRGFAAKCASCHGVGLTGVEGAGPPLLHSYYEPGHHGDGAFFVAVRNGVRAHHWGFGNMPPVAGLTDADIAAITAYVRAVQKANGIF